MSTLSLKKKYYRIAVRIVSLAVALLIIGLYFLVLYVFSVTFEQNSKFQEINSFFLKVYYILDHGIYRGILGIGLPPIILTIYFLIVCKAPKSNLWGMLIVCISIFPIHYVLFFYMDADTLVVVTIQFAQLLFTFYLIAYWKEKGVEEKFKKESQIFESERN